MTDVIKTVVEATSALAAAGLSDLVWGHASIRDPDGQGVWMKASGLGFDEVGPSEVVLVDPAGQVLSGDGKRHIEFPIHTEVMAARPDVQCVVHTHSIAVNAFSSLTVDLHPLSHDAVPFCYPQLPRFTETGALIATAELGRSLSLALGEASAILLPHHGAVTVGPDAGTAVMLAVLLERACRTELLALNAGGPKVWSDESETLFKRGQVWNGAQLNAGYEYLVRQAGRSNVKPPG